MNGAYITNGIYRLVDSEMTTSIHHSVHASVAAQGPHAGTQTKQVILTIVARPIGNVPDGNYQRMTFAFDS